MSIRRICRGSAAVVVALTGLVFVLSIPMAWAAPGWSTFFEDTFDGAAVDSARWNTSIATAGARWCPDAPTSTIGTWTPDPTAPPGCKDVTQDAPFGAIVVGSGAAAFTAGETRAFPYVFRGPPSGTSPFPRNGKFGLEVRMKYDTLEPNGSGVVATAWADSSPTGGGFPFGQLAVFQVWGGEYAGSPELRVGTVGGEATVANPTDWHVYRLEYVGRSYALWVDDVLRLGPTSSKVRPTTLWIGNPTFTHWGLFDWSDFAVDYIRVIEPAAGKAVG